MMQALEQQSMEGWAALSPFQCFTTMTKTTMFTQVMFVVALAGFAQVGVIAVLPQLLEIKLGFTAKDLVSFYLACTLPVKNVLLFVFFCRGPHIIQELYNTQSVLEPAER